MNFTREPIIETIITPKDGYKLVVRNSKGGAQEEYHVDAVEVVSFGHSFFFRSLERPKSFLVPASDYEVVETKETRVVLKNVNIERSIKIGGGRQPQPAKESVEVAASSDEEKVVAEEIKEATAPRSERKRERRRNRRGRRGGAEERAVAAEETGSKETQEPAAALVAQGGGAIDETQVSSSMFSSLFPPPPTLISETISRYKEKGSESLEGDLLPQSMIGPADETTEPVLTETSPSEQEEPSMPSPAKEAKAAPKERRRKKKEEAATPSAPEPDTENGEEGASSGTPAHLHRVTEDDNDYFMI